MWVAAAEVEVEVGVGAGEAVGRVSGELRLRGRWGVLALEAGSRLATIVVVDVVVDGGGRSAKPVTGNKYGNCALKGKVGMVGTEILNSSCCCWIW